MSANTETIDEIEIIPETESEGSSPELQDSGDIMACDKEVITKRPGSCMNKKCNGRNKARGSHGSVLRNIHEKEAGNTCEHGQADLSLDEISMKCVREDGESAELSSQQMGRSKPPLINDSRNREKFNLPASSDSPMLFEVECSDDDAGEIYMEEVRDFLYGMFNPADLENTASCNKKHISNDSVERTSEKDIIFVTGDDDVDVVVKHVKSEGEVFREDHTMDMECDEKMSVESELSSDATQDIDPVDARNLPSADCQDSETTDGTQDDGAEDAGCLPSVDSQDTESTDATQDNGAKDAGSLPSVDFQATETIVAGNLHVAGQDSPHECSRINVLDTDPMSMIKCTVPKPRDTNQPCQHCFPFKTVNNRKRIDGTQEENLTTTSPVLKITHVRSLVESPHSADSLNQEKTHHSDKNVIKDIGRETERSYTKQPGTKLLDGNDTSEMEVPGVQILCETLSSIIAHKEIRHIDNAVDVLWKLYTVYPEIVPFRSFGNLLIDIIIFKACVSMTDDEKNCSQFVNDMLELFKLPEDVPLMEEHKEWLMAKYGNISSSLSELFHLEHKDRVLNAFLQCIDQIWVELSNNTESYIEKVNEGRGTADVVSHCVQHSLGDSRQGEQADSGGPTTSENMETIDEIEIIPETESEGSSPELQDSGDIMACDKEVGTKRPGACMSKKGKDRNKARGSHGSILRNIHEKGAENTCEHGQADLSLDEISTRCVREDGESAELSSHQMGRSKPPLISDRKNWEKLNLPASSDSSMLFEVDSSDDDAGEIYMEKVRDFLYGMFNPADLENIASVSKKHISNNSVDSSSSKANADRQIIFVADDGVDDDVVVKDVEREGEVFRNTMDMECDEKMSLESDLSSDATQDIDPVDAGNLPSVDSQDTETTDGTQDDVAEDAGSVPSVDCQAAETTDATQDESPEDGEYFPSIDSYDTEATDATQDESQADDEYSPLVDSQDTESTNAALDNTAINVGEVESSVSKEASKEDLRNNHRGVRLVRNNCSAEHVVGDIRVAQDSPRGRSRINVLDTDAMSMIKCTVPEPSDTNHPRQNSVPFTKTVNNEENVPATSPVLKITHVRSLVESPDSADALNQEKTHHSDKNVIKDLGQETERSHTKQPCTNLLGGNDTSEMELPGVPILCATLSSIIANKEIQHIDKAVDVLWKLYTVYPEIVPFRSFGNLLIDIVIFKACVSMTDDEKNCSQFVNDMLELFKLPEDVPLMEEHKEWLMAKYGNISSSLSELFHLEHKDRVLNAFLQCIDHIWVALRNNTESYIEKVNEGRATADMNSHRVQHSRGDSRQGEQADSGAPTTSANTSTIDEFEIIPGTQSSESEDNSPELQDSGDILARDKEVITERPGSCVNKKGKGRNKVKESHGSSLLFKAESSVDESEEIGMEKVRDFLYGMCSPDSESEAPNDLIETTAVLPSANDEASSSRTKCLFTALPSTKDQGPSSTASKSCATVPSANEQSAVIRTERSEQNPPVGKSSTPLSVQHGGISTLACSPIAKTVPPVTSCASLARRNLSIVDKNDKESTKNPFGTSNCLPVGKANASLPTAEHTAADGSIGQEPSIVDQDNGQSIEACLSFVRPSSKPDSPGSISKRLTETIDHVNISHDHCYYKSSVAEDEQHNKWDSESVTYDMLRKRPSNCSSGLPVSKKQKTSTTKQSVATQSRATQQKPETSKWGNIRAKRGNTGTKLDDTGTTRDNTGAVWDKYVTKRGSTGTKQDNPGAKRENTRTKQGDGGTKTVVASRNHIAGVCTTTVAKKTNTLSKARASVAKIQAPKTTQDSQAHQTITFKSDESTDSCSSYDIVSKDGYVESQGTLESASKNSERFASLEKNRWSSTEDDSDQWEEIRARKRRKACQDLNNPKSNLNQTTTMDRFSRVENVKRTSNGQANYANVRSESETKVNCREHVCEQTKLRHPQAELECRCAPRKISSKRKRDVQSSTVASEGVQNSERQNPEVPSSEVQSSELENPEVQCSEVLSPSVQRSEMQSAEVRSSMVQSSALQCIEIQSSSSLESSTEDGSEGEFPANRYRTILRGTVTVKNNDRYTKKSRPQKRSRRALPGPNHKRTRVEEETDTSTASEKCSRSENTPAVRKRRNLLSLCTLDAVVKLKPLF